MYIRIMAQILTIWLFFDRNVGLQDAPSKQSRESLTVPGIVAIASANAKDARNMHKGQPDFVLHMAVGDDVLFQDVTRVHVTATFALRELHY
jgi:hypothetical protein